MILYLLSFLILLFILSIIIFPQETESLTSHVGTLMDYGDSVLAIEKKIASEVAPVADYGNSIFLTHGMKTGRVVVFYHGFTNCPRQYEELAKRFFERGYNVYVPRVPHHGVGDLQTKEIGKLTIQELMDVCNSSIDIARGLGEKVTVLGLSMGGVMAAWNAQFRDDIDTAVVIVPSFGWYFFPGIVKPLINLSFLFPNMFLWWDPIKKMNRNSPYSMYHHFSSHGMGHILRLGLSVLRASKNKAPSAKRIVFMTNEIDTAVDGVNTKRLYNNWKCNGASIKQYCFSKDHKMEHDIIDPLHPYAKIDFVYDKIFEHI